MSRICVNLCYIAGHFVVMVWMEIFHLQLECLILFLSHNVVIGSSHLSLDPNITYKELDIGEIMHLIGVL